MSTTKSSPTTLTKDHEKVFRAWIKEGYVNDDTINNYLYFVRDWYQKEKEKNATWWNGIWKK